MHMAASDKNSLGDRREELHLEKLDCYKTTPRRTDSRFFQDFLHHPSMKNRDNPAYIIQYAELIYASVVQADDNLWAPGTGENLSAVIVYTDDKDLRYDIEWLQELAKKVSALKDTGEPPEDCSKVAEALKEGKGTFHYKLSPGLTGGKNAWCGTFQFPDQSELPYGCLPPDGILPFLLFSNESVRDRHSGLRHEILTPLLFGRDTDTPELIEIPGRYYIQSPITP